MPDPSRLGAEVLRAVVGRIVAAIHEKSDYLKGTMIKALKDASHSMLEVLASRTEPDGSRRVRADNARLQREVNALKAELKAHRREFVQMKASAAKAAVSKGPFFLLKRSIIS